jgi:hypothetical protein
MSADTISLSEHLKILRDADKALAEERHSAQDRFATERDRRYTEVNIEREKALKIKETADLAALGLAREIQTYKDEKANQLREQINSERGLYATKDDLASATSKLELTMKPALDFVTSQGGRSQGMDRAWYFVFALGGIVVAVALFVAGKVA